jgi:choline dehydrogenase-like flavoprotein
MASSGDLPRWGSAYKERLEAFTHITASTGHSTSLPLESNNVSIDPKLKDSWGIPAMRLTYKDHPDDLKFAKFLQDRSYEVLDAAGAKKLWREDINENSGGVHLLGTARMGNDPQSSVVDKYHRTHDVKNLFLCDGSSFVTSGRGQPTMTIWALAFRAGDYISQFAKRNDV